MEQELIAAQRHDEGFWTANTDDSQVPFPFIATCLITGASFGLEDGYYHGVSVEPFGMAYDEGDNNNGKNLDRNRSYWRVELVLFEYTGY